MNFSETELRELLPLVALGMATPEELRAVTAALEVDALLRAEYAQVQRAMTGIPAAIAPPPVRATKQNDPVMMPPGS